VLNVDGLPTFIVVCPTVVKGVSSIYFKSSNSNNCISVGSCKLIVYSIWFNPVLLRKDIYL